MQQNEKDHDRHFAEGGKVDMAELFLNLRDTLPDDIGAHVDVGALKDLVFVVRCKDCKHCQPYKQDQGFYCEAWDTDFFTPTYDAATYYCADGIRRDGDVRS